MFAIRDCARACNEHSSAPQAVHSFALEPIYVHLCFYFCCSMALYAVRCTLYGRERLNPRAGRQAGAHLARRAGASPRAQSTLFARLFSAILSDPLCQRLPYHRTPLDSWASGGDYTSIAGNRAVPEKMNAGDSRANHYACLAT